MTEQKIIEINEEKFLKAQWEFYQPLGKIYKHFLGTPVLVKNIEFIPHVGHVFVNKIDYEKYEEILTFEEFKKYQLEVIKTPNKSINYKLNGYLGFKNDNNFLLSYLNIAPEDRFKIVSNYNFFFSYHNDAVNDYENILNLPFNYLKPKQALQFVLNMSVSELEMTKGLLNKLKEYLSPKLDKKIVDKFFYDFLKKRENQIQRSSIKSYTRDFILKNVSDVELLKKYNKFFPYLSEIDKYKDINIFEDSDEKIFSFIFNPKRMELKYDMLGYTSLKYVSLSKMIFTHLNSHYNLNSFDLISISPPKGTANSADATNYKCYVSHNTEMTKEAYIKIFTDILEKCISKPEDTVTTEWVNKLIETYKLDLALPKSGIKNKTNKL